MNYAIVADDEPHILRVAELALRAIRCEVLTVSDGDEAWQAIHDRRPDILVSDVQMPKIDGIQLVKLIRESTEFRDLSVVLLTAKSFELAAKDSELVQTCTLMGKPFSPTALAREVRRLLSSTAAS